MFDTMTFTKVVGGFCGAFLVFLLGKWGAEEIYHVGIEAHGDEREMAYVIETGEEDGGGEEAAPVDFATLWQNADADAGERVFNQCRACHQLEEGANAVGPYLYGVVGREIGSANGYGSYSGALSEQDAQHWDPRVLDAFLENPQGWAPGTSMSYSGISDPEDRANLIAYLNTFDGNAEVGVLEGEEAPAEGGGEEAAAEEAPAESEGSEQAAAEEAPAEGEGSEQAAAEEAPAEGEGSEQAAAEEAPAESEGSEQAAAEEAPAEGEGSEQAAAEEAPAEGEGSEQAAAQEAPAEGEGSEQAAAEEAPAEGEGSEQAAAEGEGSGGDSEIVAMVENADASAGESVFNRCRACHQINGSNGVGPYLNGVVGREIGAVESYSNYSGALTEQGADVWTVEHLFNYLENPREWAPGTSMSYAGLRSEEDRANLIAYLQTLSE
ncbi:Cytochrome c-552 [Roseivivax jejudonensis]|uniref:Cytochrome c-552 n=1 Tax=Roseivivax jejudonensis TaxID=1529041 RepID=A0A1X6ZJI7_9RHOB|nr:cytochrome c family protein [Roseivivax jejudonensis]SLN52828.1 Cytochrome c-552 [Roseivivax jejudonensis]